MDDGVGSVSVPQAKSPAEEGVEVTERSDEVSSPGMTSS